MNLNEVMTYEQFKKVITITITAYLPDEYQNAKVKITPVWRNNDIRLDGLEIKKNAGNTAPLIYLNSYYDDFKNGRDIEDILKHIAQSRVENEIGDIDLFSCIYWKNVKDKIVAEVVNADANKQSLMERPHILNGDFAVIYGVLLKEEDSERMILPIRNAHMITYGIDVETLHEAAMEHMRLKEKVRMEKLSDFIGINLGEDIEDECPLYILTNQSVNKGAAVILDDTIMQMVAEKIGGDFYIIPSSVHEVLVLEKNDKRTRQELEKMIRDVNENHIEPEEKLSDYLYEYNATEHEMVRSDFAEKRDMRKENSNQISLKDKLGEKKEQVAAVVKDMLPENNKREAVLA